MTKIFQLIFLFSLFAVTSKGQVNTLELSPEKEKMYSPYMLFKHQGSEGLAAFKKNKPHQYLQELWYYSESFYVKRDYFSTGAELDVAIIDVSRFESERDESVEKIIVLPGFKDVIVLLPTKNLIYKP